VNINEVKSELGYEVLNLNTANDKDGNPTEWLRHWDNDKRVAVSLHKDTFNAIKAGDATTLGLQHETRDGEKGSYEAVRIVMFTPAEFTL